MKIPIRNCSRLLWADLDRVMAQPVDRRSGGTDFRVLPLELRRLIDPGRPDACSCSACCPVREGEFAAEGPRAPAFWDVLACAMEGRELVCWTVHYPELARSPEDSHGVNSLFDEEGT